MIWWPKGYSSTGIETAWNTTDREIEGMGKVLVTQEKK